MTDQPSMDSAALAMINYRTVDEKGRLLYPGTTDCIALGPNFRKFLLKNDHLEIEFYGDYIPSYYDKKRFFSRESRIRTILFAVNRMPIKYDSEVTIKGGLLRDISVSIGMNLSFNLLEGDYEQDHMLDLVTKDNLTSIYSRIYLNNETTAEECTIGKTTFIFKTLSIEKVSDYLKKELDPLLSSILREELSTADDFSDYSTLNDRIRDTVNSSKFLDNVYQRGLKVDSIWRVEHTLD